MAKRSQSLALFLALSACAFSGWSARNQAGLESVLQTAGCAAWTRSCRAGRTPDACSARRDNCRITSNGIGRKLVATGMAGDYPYTLQGRQ